MTSRAKRPTLILGVAVMVAVIAGCGGGGGPDLGSTGDAGLAPIETTAGGQARVIIGYKQTPGPPERALVRGAGGKVKRTYHLIPAMAATVPAAAIDGLRNNPNVTYIEGDATVSLLNEDLDWGADRINAEIVWGRFENAVDAHGPGPTGAGVKVAVIDTGIDYSHPDLDGNYSGGYDVVNGDDDPMDDDGHGTVCAGIIAAEDNGEGVLGVAPEARVYAVKAFNTRALGYTSDIIAGLEWCVVNGMDIVSMSFGGTAATKSERDACDAAYSANILLVAAAGNSGNQAGNGNHVIAPAEYESVIAVGATNPYDRRAPFSSTGPELDLMGPGVRILAPEPGGGYGRWGGTSMACPHVSGVAALLIEQGMTSAPDVRSRLQSTAEDLGDPGLDSQFGYGLADAAAATGVTPLPALPGTEAGILGGAAISAQNGHGVGGATVTVVDTGQSAVTRANGTYFIFDVPPGMHTVTCVAGGYQTASQAVEIGADETARLDFSLVPQ